MFKTLPSRIFQRSKGWYAMDAKSFSSPAEHDVQSHVLFECPRKEFGRFVSKYYGSKMKENSSVGFIYKDRLWNLYSRVNQDYHFSEAELRTVLKLVAFTSLDNDLKVERVQQVIEKMISMGYNPGGDGLNALISANANHPNAIDKIESLLYNWKHSPPQTKRVYNKLLQIYGKIHGTEVAEKWFDSLVGTMIYTEMGLRSQTLRPLIKDGGVYCQLIKMYCEEGIVDFFKNEGNLEKAIERFKEMFKMFDQSNRNGALVRILSLLMRQGKYYEVLAWYTTAKMNYMYFDETGFFRVIRTILFYGFSKNILISANEIIDILGQLGSKWKLTKEERIVTSRDDMNDFNSLLSSLNVANEAEVEVASSPWYYSKDNCLETNEKEESALNTQMDSFESNTIENSKISGIAKDDLRQIKGIFLNYLSTALFKSYNFDGVYKMHPEAMPHEYDEKWLKQDPKALLESVFADMFKKEIKPTLLTFNAIIYGYYKIGAFKECATMFEYAKSRLDIYYDSTTISIMCKVYSNLGEYSKCAALNTFTDEEIVEGDLALIGAQLDLLFLTGNYKKLEEIFKMLDNVRDIGSRNYTFALRMYLKENKMDEARKMFERIIRSQMEEGQFVAIPFNIMLSYLSRVKDMDGFKEILNRMNELNIEFGEDTYVAIMRAYASNNQQKTALEYHRKMVSSGVKQTIISYHCLIDIFSKINNESGIMDTLKNMIRNGIMPNENTLYALANYYVKHGKIKEARDLQDFFKKSFPHISKNIRCHNLIISYYARIQDRAGVLEELKRAITVYNTLPDIDTYINMIEVFSVADIDGARKIFDLALERCHGNLNQQLFSIMMEAYYRLGDYDAVKSIYTRMAALEVEPDAKTLEILSFVGQDKWRNAPDKFGTSPLMIVHLVYLSLVYCQTYDFSGFPPRNIPPPTNPAWNAHYGIQSGITTGVKTPLNSVSYPQCPVSRDSCDFSCYNCTRPEDITFCPNARDFGMTFDDGPSNNSIMVLDTLKQLNAKATFCVLGSQVTLYPEVLLRMYTEGHTICAHTWSHRYLTSQTDEEIVAEFEWTLQAIQLVIGVRPNLARAPFGDIDDRVRSVFAKMNLINLLWNKDTFDWKFNNPALYNFSGSYVIGNLSQWISSGKSDPQGSIILEHDVLPDSAKLGVESLYMVNNASLKITSIEYCIGKKVHEAPFVPPNTTTPTEFPKPSPRASNNGSFKPWINLWIWLFVSSSIVKFII